MSKQKKLDSPDREKILDTLVQTCSWVDSCIGQCTPADHENCYGYLVNVIEPLIKDARIEQAAFDQLNFDKERVAFWTRIKEAREQEKKDIYSLLCPRCQGILDGAVKAE